jgi:hypothetical protein
LIPDSWFAALAEAETRSSKQLEKQFGAEAARWASQQVELRKKARAKFADADQMLFDREALEQATHEVIATYHVSCYPPDANVVDITTGIGSDLRAFAKMAGATGFELDPLRAEYARHNCPGAEIQVGDGLEFAQNNPIPYIWADPDRRDIAGRRLIEPSQYQPNPLEIPRDRELTGIKLSPLLQDEYLEEVGQRIEFVSYKSECREAIAWSGKLVEPGFFCVDAETRAVLPRHEIEDQVDQPYEFIFDCDPAATRAHALGNFNMPQLGDSPGYLTGSEYDSPWLAAYEVLDHGSFDLKRIKEALRKNFWRVFEVKQRAAGLDPTTVIKQLKTDGELVSLIAWKVDKSVRYALVKRTV